VRNQGTTLTLPKAKFSVGLLQDKSEGETQQIFKVAVQRQDQSWLTPYV
jgi:hypothetical protein